MLQPAPELGAPGDSGSRAAISSFPLPSRRLVLLSSSQLRSHPTRQRHLQRLELAAILGDDVGHCTSKQEGGLDRHCKLCQPMLTLSLATLLPDIQRALLPSRWRPDLVWLLVHGTIVLGCEVVGEAAKQEA